MQVPDKRTDGANTATEQNDGADELEADGQREEGASAVKE